MIGRMISAFGAMMLLVPGQKFRKLRFQMIADTVMPMRVKIVCYICFISDSGIPISFAIALQIRLLSSMGNSSHSRM